MKTFWKFGLTKIYVFEQIDIEFSLLRITLATHYSFPNNCEWIQLLSILLTFSCHWKILIAVLLKKKGVQKKYLKVRVLRLLFIQKHKLIHSLMLLCGLWNVVNDFTDSEDYSINNISGVFQKASYCAEKQLQVNKKMKMMEIAKKWGWILLKPL